MHSSIREIRRRLLNLLLRAFVIVLFLSFLIFTLIIGYFLTSSSTPVPIPFVSTLEGYYLASGNWQGVEVAFDSMPELDAMSTLLLDEEQRIVLDQRLDSASEVSSTPTVGTNYTIQSSDVVFNLAAHGEPIGYLVITPYSLSQRFGFARAIVFPIGVISLLLATFLVVVANLLMRRFVNPLADVIYAARAVTDGKLDTRISTEGPQDLRTLSESFNVMASSLERNDRERRDFLADIAHELRTPLSVIRGRLEGIIDGIYAENGPQVSTALEQTYLLERLVDDLRLLTLAEKRQLVFDKTTVDVGNLIATVIDMLSAQAQEKNISLVLSERNGNLSAQLDPQRFEQVLSNLIGNALRYVPDGGRVWVTANETAEGLSVTVNDNGLGIPEEDLPFIFDRFWRKEKSRSRASGGTGLGLAISKQLIEAQGGRIEARNLPEGGLQILISLFKEEL
ncbi:MAG: HAMP domain-containing protein [Anaerolineales bacterium]|uniref:sensor histidine kinase n=1 Tax=Candidatus Villigracilis vicinus TaxID=3140679 RepID=UPI003135D784|nr:HAMP domain-containing protein [Anaerolineales bacterium]